MELNDNEFIETVLLAGQVPGQEVRIVSTVTEPPGFRFAGVGKRTGYCAFQNRMGSYGPVWRVGDGVAAIEPNVPVSVAVAMVP